MKTILQKTQQTESRPAVHQAGGDGRTIREAIGTRSNPRVAPGKFLFHAFVLSSLILSGCSSAPIQRLQTEMLAEQQVINLWGRDFANLNEVTDRFQREHLAQIKELADEPSALP